MDPHIINELSRAFEDDRIICLYETANYGLSYYISHILRKYNKKGFKGIKLNCTNEKTLLQSCLLHLKKISPLNLAVNQESLLTDILGELFTNCSSQKCVFILQNLKATGLLDTFRKFMLQKNNSFIFAITTRNENICSILKLHYSVKKIEIEPFNLRTSVNYLDMRFNSKMSQEMKEEIYYKIKNDNEFVMPKSFKVFCDKLKILSGFIQTDEDLLKILISCILRAYKNSIKQRTENKIYCIQKSRKVIYDGFLILKDCETLLNLIQNNNYDEQLFSRSLNSIKENFKVYVNGDVTLKNSSSLYKSDVASISYAVQEQIELFIVKIYNETANYMKRQRFYGKAIDSYLEMVEILNKKEHSTEELTAIYFHLVMCYKKIGDKYMEEKYMNKLTKMNIEYTLLYLDINPDEYATNIQLSIEISAQ